MNLCLYAVAEGIEEPREEDIGAGREEEREMVRRWKDFWMVVASQNNTKLTLVKNFIMF